MTSDAVAAATSPRQATAGRRVTDGGRPRADAAQAAPARGPALDPALLAEVRRAVHDGLGPALAGIRLGLQGARNLLADHPEAGLELLAHLQGEVDLAVEAVRTLDHQLSPPGYPTGGGPGLVGSGP